MRTIQVNLMYLQKAVRLKESTLVPGIIEIIALHVKMSFNSVHDKYFDIKWVYVLH